MCLFTLMVDGPQSVYVCLLEYILHFIINYLVEGLSFVFLKLGDLFFNRILVLFSEYIISDYLFNSLFLSTLQPIS